MGMGRGGLKKGPGYVNGRYQLDRYHLNKELCAAFGRDNETKGRVWQACERGEVETSLAIMAEAHEKGQR